MNLIADAFARDQTVLFVAEKSVALEVVHTRLKEAGLGNACLVIHPGKAQFGDSSGSINEKAVSKKKALLDEIERAWYIQPPEGRANSEETI